MSEDPLEVAAEGAWKYGEAVLLQEEEQLRILTVVDPSPLHIREAVGFSVGSQAPREWSAFGGFDTEDELSSCRCTVCSARCSSCGFPTAFPLSASAVPSDGSCSCVECTIPWTCDDASESSSATQAGSEGRETPTDQGRLHPTARCLVCDCPIGKLDEKLLLRDPGKGLLSCDDALDLEQSGSDALGGRSTLGITSQSFGGVVPGMPAQLFPVAQIRQLQSYVAQQQASQGSYDLSLMTAAEGQETVTAWPECTVLLLKWIVAHQTELELQVPWTRLELRYAEMALSDHSTMAELGMEADATLFVCATMGQTDGHANNTAPGAHGFEDTTTGDGNSSGTLSGASS